MHNLTNVSIVLLLVCLGCGGAQPPPVATSDNQPSGTGEPTTAASPSSEGLSSSLAQPSNNPPPAVEAPAVGPAAITISVLVKGKPVPATVQFLDGSGKPAVEGKADEKISISSGRYEAVVQITDPTVLADKPSKRMTVELKPGQESKEQIIFPWAKIKLNVKVNGRLDANAKVKLLRDGSAVATVTSADNDYVQISPGRYQAEVITKNTKAMVDNVMFPDGATQDVPVEVQF
jgi:hypothetical protein